MKHMQSQSGETMVETLVSILISALALVMLATLIGTSVNLVRNSRDRMTDYYEAESEMNGASPSSKSGEGSVSFSVPLEVDSAGEPNPITVDVYAMEGTSGIAYYEKGA